MQDAQVTPADELIAVIPLVLGILDGQPGPWSVPESAFRGVAVLLIGTMRANAQLLGEATPEGQDALVRGQLEGMLESATLLALRHDGGLADG